MIKVIIYDLDDTLVNSDPIHTHAWNETLKPFGYSLKDLSPQVRASFTGRRVIDITKLIIEYLKLKVDPQQLCERKSNNYIKLANQELELLPGVTESLQLLYPSYPLAIGTSGTNGYVNLILDKFQLHRYFKTIISGEDVSQGKPHPETYLLAAQKLGVDATQCLVFEDSAMGIQAAKSAGCICVAIKNPNTFLQDLNQADLVLSSLHEVTDEVIKSFVKT